MAEIQNDSREETKDFDAQKKCAELEARIVKLEKAPAVTPYDDKAIKDQLKKLVDRIQKVEDTVNAYKVSPVENHTPDILTEVKDIKDTVASLFHKIHGV